MGEMGRGNVGGMGGNERELGGYRCIRDDDGGDDDDDS